MRSDLDPVRHVLAAWRGSRNVRLVRRFRHGAGGTSLVSVDGRPAVLKAWPEADAATARFPAALQRMQIIRARGVPVPAVLEHGRCTGNCFVLYEVAAGRWPASVTVPLADDMVAVVDAERGAAPASNPGWSIELARMLDTGDPAFDIDPAALASHPHGSRLLDQARRRFDRVGSDQLATGDIVHADFAPENILVDGGRLVAVVDWERSRVGDAGLDLVGAIFDTESRGRVSAAARRRLWSATRARMPDDVLACYVGLYAVRYASWAIGTEMEPDVLALTTRLLTETGGGAT